jgi:hypothetical protein
LKPIHGYPVGAAIAQDPNLAHQAMKQLVFSGSSIAQRIYLPL